MDRNRTPHHKNTRPIVALRKESVDRNMLCLSFPMVVGSSLSVRRAWIEMAVLCLSSVLLLVALRKESVDRNRHSARCVVLLSRQGRSP